MDRMAEFLAMGGYAAYVWPALGLTAAVMIALAWHAWRRLQQEEKAAAELERSRKAGSEPAGDADREAEIAA